MPIEMLPYVSLFFLLALAGLLDEHGKARPLLVPIGIVLLWFMGLREYVGCDFDAYLLRYDGQRFMGDGPSFDGSEWGFEVLTYLFAQAGFSFYVFQAVITAIIVYCYLRFASRQVYPLMVLALIYPVLVVQLGMSGLRQAVAVGFVMMAFEAFVAKQRLYTGGWIIAAFLFHSSAILLLPMAFIAGRQISLPRLIGAFVLLMPVAALLLGDRIDVYSNRYIDQVYGEQQADGAWIRYILSIVPTLFFLRYRLQIKKAFPDQYQLLLIGALFVCSLLLAGAISSVALHRFNFYALPLAALMVVYGTKAVATRPVTMRLAWLGMFGGYQLAWFTLSSNAQSCLMPYDNIMF